MTNMSYCRFHNTNIDLRDCLDAIKSGEELSDDEMNCCRKLFGQFIDFCYDVGILDSDELDYGDTNEKLEEFFGMIGNEEYWNYMN